MKAPIACCLTTATLILVPAASFATPQIGGKHNGYSICEEQALHLYAEGMKNGLDFGRNRVEDGKLLSSGRVIPEPHPCEWRDYLDRQLHPPMPVAPTTSSLVSEIPNPSVDASAVGSGGCVGMSAESGSLGYDSPNGGCYQVIPSTAAAFGCDLSTPAGQDSCAATICAKQGPSAWTNPAGQNPCGRLGG